jgi:hypothetical protein
MSDMIDHPDYYNACGERDHNGAVKYEPIKIIESWGLSIGFCLGNAIKYILRSQHKGTERQDLEKAYWYLCRLASDVNITNDKRFMPSDVSNAWNLPPCLNRAIEAIAMGAIPKAMLELAKHLDDMKNHETD